MHHDPNWPRANAWLAASEAPHDALGTLAVLGVPAAKGSISPGRCDLAPAAVREALAYFSPYDVQHDCDLTRLAARDLGDLDIAVLTPDQSFPVVRSAVAANWGRADALTLLGGDNSITHPGVLGLGAELTRCGLITFDAHFDLRDTKGGLSNGNPVRALLDAGMPGANIVQIGIQAFANSCAYAGVARQAGITIVTADEVHERGIETVVRRALDELGSRADLLYVDFDIDVLDRAFVPGCPGARPGGLAPFQLRLAARECGLDQRVRVIDLVEFDPQNDVNRVTAMTAAAVLLAFASGLADRLKASNV
ncbi:MAG TPA: agmatinase family protein [Bryobacteraceae bacterium]|nr:agmatinase family protein [Bryobacteraceae bacterium]